MELKQPCRHREGEQCIYSGRPCFGAKLDETTGALRVDYWTECTCPKYEAAEVVDLSQARPAQPPAAGDRVVIRIFGPMEAGECGDDCVAETADIQAEILQGFFNRRYGDKVRVEGIDIASEAVKDYPPVEEYVKKGASQVVMLNDEVRFLDAVDLGAIKQELMRLGVEEIKP